MIHQWHIYIERAFAGDERVYLGVIFADSMSEALNRAAQWWEIPVHNLVAILVK